MALADHLRETAICTEVECDKREDAIRVLLELSVAGGTVRKGFVDRALAAVLERERLGSTAIGKGVAVPHARLDELPRILVAFGYSAGGVEFNALDGEPVHLIFLVIAPKTGAEEYLNIMQRITRLVQNDDFRRFVAAAHTSAQVTDLVREMDK
jgi:mannitol/fructose-specific phosphotransferase system IIA component (Ntr-type)